MYSKEVLLKRRAELSAAKQALLEQQRRGEPVADSLARTTIPKRPALPLIPLSSIQERFWFLQQLDPASTHYIGVIVYRMTCLLDLPALAQTARQIVRRHEILRTTYSVVDGMVYQRVDPTLHLRLRVPLLDLQALPSEQQQPLLEQIISREQQRPLPLTEGVPWSATVLRLAPEYHISMLRVHHLIGDGWTIDALVHRELITTYRACVAGQSTPLPDLPIQYADYAYWQRQRLQAPDFAVHREYWRSHLRGAPHALRLPIDHPRPPMQQYREAAMDVRLTEMLVDQLKALGQPEQVTLFMTLLAAFAVLLARYSGQEDVVVGTSVAGREYSELEELLGCFINTLPLRLNLSGQPSFCDLLARVRTVCLNALAHQDMPVEQIVAEVQPPRDLSRSILFQVMFQLQNFPHFPPQPEEVEHVIGRADTGVAAPVVGQGQCDLMLILSESGAVQGTLVYDATLFEAATVARLCSHFVTLLEGIIASPQRPVMSISLLRAAEREEIVRSWNATEQAPPPLEVVHQLVTAQVARTPDAVAAVFAEQQLTYQELNRRANHLAHYLQTLGVGPEVQVGLCMERSLELLVGLLGILNAGGAYVPLDPHYPRQRLAFMLEDTQLEIVLTQERQRDLLPNQRARIVCVDAAWPTIAQTPATLPPTKVTGQNLAYVIYTSGASGRPKGVMVQHQSLVNFSEVASQVYAITLADRVLQFASICFDTSAEEICPCLVRGATLVLRTDSMLDSVAVFLEKCQEWALTILDLPTAYWHELVVHLSQGALTLLPPLRLVIIGGERALPERLAAWQQRVDWRVRLVNTYGPTETTIVATLADLSSTLSTPSQWQEVPIGQALRYTQVYILDRDLDPVPIGVPGELHIGGAGVARGYLNRADLTAERFIPNPFATMNDEDPTMKDAEELDVASSFIVHRSSFGTRLYRTGDRARYLADGTIEFLGRYDRQVKIRGYRIEPGEIESALARHAAVVAAAVVERADGLGGTQLVAYVVQGSGVRGQGSDDLAPAALIPAPRSLIPELRTFLMQQLPIYMLPAAIIELDALPLTANGKLDYQALPAPDQSAAGPSFEVPRTAVEQALAEVWGAVLKRERIGRNDNFFALGGHSLLASQLIYRINAVFALALPLRSLFQEPTLADLALAIEEGWLAEISAHDEPDPLGLQVSWPLPLATSLIDPLLLPSASDAAFTTARPEADPARAQRRAELAARQAQLSSAQQALLSSRLQHVRSDQIRAALPPIPPRPAEAPVPLAFAQEALWLQEQLTPGTTLYNISRVERLHGKLDRAALEQSLQTLVQRHEPLRTHFTILDGQPVQVIAPSVPFAMALLDLRGVPPEQREAAARRFAATVQRPFALDQAPLLRVGLVQLTDSEHVLLITLHHLIADGWSLDVFVRDLTQLYSAAVAGRAATLPALPVQYGDYAVWQRSWLQGPLLVAQLAYWKQQLAGAPALLALPYDHARPAQPTLMGGACRLAVPEVVQQALRQVSQELRATVFMTLLAAWQNLLSRLSGQEDIVVGVPVAGRARAELDGLIGCFINTLALRSDVRGRPTFREFVLRVREVCLEGYAHQELPFGKLLEVLQPSRTLSHSPLFQVLFDLHNTVSAADAQLDIAGSSIEQTTSTVNYDLTLLLHDNVGRLTGVLEYSSELFEATTIERLCGHFLTLLEGIAADPDCRLCDLPLLNAAQRRQLLVDWNATAADYPQNQCIHYLFEAQVARSPDAVAVVLGEQQVTYQELNRRANQLAYYLGSLGVGAEVLIGLCVRRSMELAVGMLGILKAGAAYLPLDPDYPQERLAFLLADSQAPVLLTQASLLPRLPEWGAAPPQHTAPRHLAANRWPPKVICLDGDWWVIAGIEEANRTGDLRPSHVATAIYTSGSTGQPKGVLIPHQALVNYTLAMLPRLELQAQDRFLQFAALGFDVVLEELLPTWASGATVVLHDAELLSPADTFGQLLARSGVTVVELPAHYWQAWVYELTQTNGTVPVWLRLVLVGCEQPTPASLVAWQQFGISLIHVYGLSETTITTSLYHLAAGGEAAPARPLPIGRPIANTQLYVLDPQMQPVPLGVPGELYIGGAGLARGYLNRPDQTAERFVPNPFWGMGDGGWGMGDASPIPHPPSPGTRLYKTGDLVRYQTDGNIEFLGRYDRQVKLRGYRIELGEIEAALAQHTVVQAAVVERADGLGGTQLVAYVVQGSGIRGQGSDDLAPAALIPDPRSLIPELRGFLKEQLPIYMLPAAIIELDALPLTPNGKLDYQALPAPDLATAPGFEAPQTTVEQALAEVWGAVLKRERIGRNDNFFALGGHSLLAFQLIYRINAVFALALPLRSLFQEPTLADLALAIEEGWLAEISAHDEADLLGLYASWPALPGDPLVDPLTDQSLHFAPDPSDAVLMEAAPEADGVRAERQKQLRVRQAQLRPAQQALLSSRLQHVRSDHIRVALPPIPPRPAEAPVPLAFAQEALWLQEQLTPGTTLYNISRVERLHGALDHAAFEQSLQTLVQRHEPLRTHFTILDGQPVQVIAPSVPLTLALLDLRGVPPEQYESAARQFGAKVQRPFALDQAPLLRVALVQLADSEHVLLITLHHLIADDWSLGVFFRDLTQLYSAAVAGRAATLPVLPVQYGDYAVWQRSWLQGPLLDAQLAYWKQQLAGAPALLALPCDHARPAQASFAGGTCRLAVPEAVQQALRQVSQELRATVFMTLLAAWQSLLSRLSGQEDIVVGVPVAGRGRAELDDLVGCFINTLVLRSDVRGRPTFREFVARVREVCLDGYAHQDLPFGKLLEALQPSRTLSHSPLFQVLFDLQTTVNQAEAEISISGTSIEQNSTSSKYDLTLALQATPERLSGVLEYSSELFEAVTIERLCGHFLTLLAGIVTDPDRRLSDLPLLNAAERQQLLVDWNATAADYPQNQSIHHLFEAQVARTPNAMAVVFEGEELSYQALNRRANQLAHYLRGLGVGAEVPVAVCLERSIELVVALLGVLKAGGAYLPLDPSYPKERLDFMLEDTHAPILLTQQHLVEQLPAHAAHTVCVDAEMDQIARKRSDNPAGRRHLDDLAYLIYTSGSTGRPKGIQVAHRAFANRLLWSQATYPLDQTDHVIQLASMSFDISLWELLGPLVAGARLVMVRPGGHQDLPYLIDLIAEQQISVAHFVPSLLQVLLAQAGLERWRRLRIVFCGGEAVPADLPDRFFARLPAQLHQFYGPTEAAINATTWACQRDSRQRGLLIGRPIANTQIYLLDRWLQPVPIGVPGELYIGGAGLARGYLNRPELTAERFVPNPFREGIGDKRSAGGGLGWGMEEAPPSPIPHPLSPGTRLYRTGDLVRYQADGNIEFLGRYDRQVKIRGYRIEPGEIEAALARHAAVQTAAVVERADGLGGTQLVAYVVQGSGVRGQGSDDLAPAALIPDPRSLIPELRGFLMQQLPIYMLPAAIIELDALPLTANGKLDRQALPAPDDAATTPVFEPPQTTVEQLLAEVWGAVLKRERIGRGDNFFALGGHSLLAIQLIYRINAAFALALPLRSLFQEPTLADLALAIEEGWLAEITAHDEASPLGMRVSWPVPSSSSLVEPLEEQSPDAASDTPDGVHTQAATPERDPARAQRRAELNRRQAQLTTTQRVLLAARIQRTRTARTSALLPSIPPRPAGATVPLAFAQEALWLQEQLTPGTTLYHISHIEHLHGAIDQAAFEQSIQALVQRHEALRTHFAIVDGQPVQVISPTVPFAVALLDLRGVPQEEHETAAHQFAATVQRPFALDQAPLLRVALARLDDTEYIMLLLLHHLIADGWSLNVFIRDLTQLYSAAVAGRPAALPPLPVQYGDYAVWQRDWLQGSILEAQLAYWQRQLADAPAVLPLPSDHPRPRLSSIAGGACHLVVPTAVQQALWHLSQELRGTLFMTLLAAWQSLLGRISGQTDIVVGVPVAGRDRAELDGLVGCFVNVLALRGDLRGRPTFREFAQQVREVCLDGYAHQDLPFGKLLEALQPTRTLSFSPLFQVLFDLQMVVVEPEKQLNITGSPIRHATTTSKYDLALAIEAGPDTLTGVLEYSSDLFEAVTIERLCGHFLTLLEGIAADPDRRLSDLPLLNAAERQQLLVAWNDTAADYPQDQCIQHLFEAQVVRTPDAIAVVFEGQQVSYQALNRRANHLAHYLRSLGVAPEVLVAICLERSLELVVALLGVLKAGGAYLPLDPNYPKERLHFMLEDTRAPLLLTQQHLLAQLPAHLAHTLCVDAEWDQIARMRSDTPAGGARPDHLAYVIYTSGSTGRPKGVLVDQRNLCHTLWATQERFCFTAEDVQPWIAPVVFDIALFELFSPLLVGGRVVLLGSEQVLNLPRLLVTLRGCTVLHAVPSLMQQIVQAIVAAAPSEAAYDQIRQLFVGGEAVPPALLGTMRMVFRRAMLWVLYGPTEATIISSCVLVSSEAVVRTRLMGRPLPNVQTWLLDRHGNYVPIGVAGELYLGGAGVTRGYLGRPDLTAERFVPNPFRGVLGDGCWVLEDSAPVTQHPTPNTRLYRTGDQARYRDDGTLEFLGRVDRQVKIRGFRIEPGEIEAALARHAAVQAAAVVERADGLGGAQMVAYVVTGNELQVTSSDEQATSSLIIHDSSLVTELRTFLMQQLPAYMLPSAIVRLAALPLTPNGKLDQQALPDPGLRAGQALVAPRDTLEMHLVQIWESILARAPIGVSDDFFALGGHSLLAVRLIDAIQRRLGSALPLSTLFQAPTIEQLARLIRQQPSASTPQPPLVAFRASGTLPPFFCVHPIDGGVFCYAALAQQLGADLPFYGLEAPGLYDEQPPHEDLVEMARAYVAAIRSVQPQGPYRLGGWSSGGVVAFEMAQQLQRQGQTVIHLVLFDTSAPGFEPAPDIDDNTMMSDFIDNLAGGMMGTALPLMQQQLQHLTLDAQLRYVVEHGGAVGLLPPDMDVEQLRRRFMVYRANVRALGRYRAEPAALPLALFRPSVQMSNSQSALGRNSQSALGWEQINAGPITVQTVEGDHVSILRWPQVTPLAEQVRYWLGKAA